MYKIFFEHRALCFINIDERDVFSSDLEQSSDSERHAEYVGYILKWLNDSDKDYANDTFTDACALSSAIRSVFRLAPAAGGVVVCGKSFVSIVRNGVPDLPKGHIENGESPSEAALREVKEETGIDCVMAGDELPNTWHCYRLNGEWVLKRTYWYHMKPSGEVVLTPQQEEGITEVLTVDGVGVDSFLCKTYRSISEIIGPCLRGFVAK